ncbi:hypothetical protein ACGFOU_11540 [Streptomyces sp. NPDC048595]|uniref:hypothetical protein n=1 Tax=Streptomyces sp. NPDC048595 TaxID=3365576 RepID=UPI0037110363
MPGTDDHPTPAAGTTTSAAEDPTAPAPRADCLHCGRPTEYPADRPGIVLCPVCEWQEAQRTACSG